MLLCNQKNLEQISWYGKLSIHNAPIEYLLCIPLQIQLKMLADKEKYIKLLNLLYNKYIIYILCIFYIFTYIIYTYYTYIYTYHICILYIYYIIYQVI